VTHNAHWRLRTLVEPKILLSSRYTSTPLDVFASSDGSDGLINMAYDASLNSDVAVAPAAFRRDERFAVLFGGAAVGIAAGFGIAMALGRTGDWAMFAAIRCC
jgi:hypothetical protein